MSNKYQRTIIGLDGVATTVDVYDVLLAFNISCPAMQHALKKMLCSGLRGHKPSIQDKQEAIDSILRSIQLERQNNGETISD